MFRAEAVEAQKQKLHGDVFLTQPLSFTALALLLFSLVAILAVLLFTGSYSRSEHVVGHIVPSKGLVRIQASQFGTLDDIFVEEGQEVIVGQSLAVIKLSQNALDGGFYAEKSMEAILLQQQTLQTQIDLEEGHMEAEASRLLSDKTQTELLISSLQQQVALQGQITSTSESAYKDVQVVMDQGFVSKVESDRRYQTWLAHQVQLELKEQELVSAKAKLDQLEIELEHLPSESEKNLARLIRQQGELEARKVDLEARSAYVITSPVDGRVVTISSASVGRSVQAGQPFLTILPQDSVLEAELFVPSSAIGFVEEGQEVKLLYDAFPYQRFGAYAATVTSVTQSILSPSEVIAPFEIDQPVYRIIAKIETDTIEARGRHIALQTGMTLKANIVLERRSFIDWLLEPLRALRGRS